MRGDCDEETAVKWHSSRVPEGYTHFLLVVLSALKQIRKQDQPILSDCDEDGFETACAHFRPRTADVTGKLSQEEINKTVDFCLNAFEYHAPEKHEAVLRRMETAMLANNAEAPAALSTAKTEAQVEEKAIVDPEGLSPDELRILKTIRARQMLRQEDTLSIDSFTSDAINGWLPLVHRGSLVLRKAGAKALRQQTAPLQPSRQAVSDDTSGMKPAKPTPRAAPAFAPNSSPHVALADASANCDGSFGHPL
ncbi:hypothetical protein HO173_006257 [Letharia columbiana]|uniref:Uncharacterized protein n=1 Tax=Letharia columbiana TaxID=112416 RepID=A0A8H6FVI1_9LECA|nr:uncharacterized protein HO173_006257 [Letharia columbiana]KAF6235574.1 hypothetical protein HO173_006257 [Letharia columbiana]